MNRLTLIPIWLLANLLLGPQATIAQGQPSPEAARTGPQMCQGCIPAGAAEALSGFSYRGRLGSQTSNLAVITREEREQVVSVGDTLAGAWTVIAIDGQAVTFQQMSTGVYQRLWFGGGQAQMPVDAPLRGPLRPRLRWDGPLVVQAGSEFSVMLSLHGMEVRGGTITLEYDPQVLVMTDATGRWEDDHGRAHLQVAEVGDGDYLAEVAFRVAAQGAAATRLRVLNMTLLDDAGSPIPVPVESDLQLDLAVATTPTDRMR